MINEFIIYKYIYIIRVLPSLLHFRLPSSHLATIVDLKVPMPPTPFRDPKKLPTNLDIPGTWLHPSARLPGWFLGQWNSLWAGKKQRQWDRDTLDVEGGVLLPPKGSGWPWNVSCLPERVWQWKWSIQGGWVVVASGGSQLINLIEVEWLWIVHSLLCWDRS